MKRRMTKRKTSIRNNLMLSFGSIILLMVICQIAFNTFFAKKIFVYEKSKVLEKAFWDLSASYSGDIEDMEKFAEDMQNQNGIRILIFSDDQIIFSNQRTNINKQGSNKIQKNIWFDEIEYSKNPKVEIRQQDNFEHMESLQINGKFDYEAHEICVQMMIPMASIDNSVSVFTKSEIYISIVILGAGFFIAFFLAKKITAPISNIEKVSKSIAESDFSNRADEQVLFMELSSLANSINQMSDQLMKSMCDLQSANQLLQKDIDYQKKIEKLRKEFIASVSHEMKTPLSLLQIYTENLRCSDLEIDKEYYYDTILEETGKLSDMISKMLEISSLDCGFTQLKCCEFDFSELVEDIIVQYEPMMNNYCFQSNIQRNLLLNGDALYLEQSIKNLLNNAIQYTRVNGVISITLEKMQSGIRLWVYNEGSHISDDSIEHIWDAFYREDLARTRTQKNNIGLGLYIVKTIIDKHMGKCYANNVEHGVEFVIELPTP